jgi:alkylation response protein AidB-like acyl-CoA dehydrogenase
MDDLDILRANIAEVLARDCEARALHDFLNGRGGDLAASLQRQAGELGWLGIGVSEEAGGLGFGIAGAALLTRELGRRLAPGPSVPVLACLEVIDRFAPPEVAVQVLPGLMSGERTAAIPASFDADETNGWLLGDIVDGSVMLLPGADGLMLAMARAPGEPAQDRGAWDRTRALWQAPSDIDALCTLPGEAAACLEGAANLLITADALGAMEGLFALTTDYLKQREQFGVPIGSFQALKHRMADMAASIELADCLLEQALDAATTPDAAFWAGLCKAEVTDAAALLAAECLQLHGAIGFTWEHDCHLYLKRVRLDQAMVRSNHALRQAGFAALEAAAADSRSLMEIGQ